MDRDSIWRRLPGALGGMTLLLAVAVFVWRVFLFTWAANWGSTQEERSKPLPGDEFGDQSAPHHTCGLTIQAPPAEVWKWLIQIGQDRGGFYSYTFLENMLGADIHNTNEIRPEWQEMKVGDTVRLARDEGVIQLEVLDVEPGRALVLTGWGAFVLDPAPDGRSCRLLVRSRAEARPLLRFVLSVVLDPIHFLMQRRMLLGIEEMAEAETAAARPLIPTTSDYIWFFSISGSCLLLPVMLLARRRPGWLPIAVGLSALATLVLYRLPPLPQYGIAMAALILSIFVWRVLVSRPPRPS